VLDSVAPTRPAFLEQLVDLQHLLDRHVAIGVRADAQAGAVGLPHRVGQVLVFSDHHASGSGLAVWGRDRRGRAGHAAVGEELHSIDAQRIAEIDLGQREAHLAAAPAREQVHAKVQGAACIHRAVHLDLIRRFVGVSRAGDAQAQLVALRLAYRHLDQLGARRGDQVRHQRHRALLQHAGRRAVGIADNHAAGRVGAGPVDAGQL
jgi:hypothetical protein